MSGQRIGYARVSTSDQDTSIQVEQLQTAGCDRIFHENASGSSQNRTQLNEMLNFIRKGDTLVFTRIDRLARSLRDLQNLVHDFQQKGIAIKATEQPIDTNTAAGKAFLNMLGVFAEFETNIRKERQMEGIAKAKTSGVYKGRKPISEDVKKEVIRLHNDGVKKVEIIQLLGVGRTSVYNTLKECR
ncbi:recombinase family protein [Colwellia hornerae]|uniref:Recombinase family protein n=1 Tax=Colwellia hornerae TaxID=89402 RepID=A0A5C6QGN8_9GAMM|nr:recombinase family protein [Colwellia hornerae]TWX55251.1 recombinase family protein [Colwellia hornerae]TWX61251.1 recombinase family protein [Colwellia hornerae]TWX67702.1 recombinase family protein [Colwellia hornerae]